jgi:hypothetical protein
MPSDGVFSADLPKYWLFLIEKKQNLFPDTHFLIRCSLFVIPYSNLQESVSGHSLPYSEFLFLYLVFEMSSAPTGREMLF